MKYKISFEAYSSKFVTFLSFLKTFPGLLIWLGAFETPLLLLTNAIDFEDHVWGMLFGGCVIVALVSWVLFLLFFDLDKLDDKLSKSKKNKHATKVSATTPNADLDEKLGCFFENLFYKAKYGGFNNESKMELMIYAAFKARLVFISELLNDPTISESKQGELVSRFDCIMFSTLYCSARTVFPCWEDTLYFSERMETYERVFMHYCDRPDRSMFAMSSVSDMLFWFLEFGWGENTLNSPSDLSDLEMLKMIQEGQQIKNKYIQNKQIQMYDRVELTIMSFISDELSNFTDLLKGQ